MEVTVAANHPVQLHFAKTLAIYRITRLSSPNSGWGFIPSHHILSLRTSHLSHFSIGWKMLRKIGGTGSDWQTEEGRKSWWAKDCCQPSFDWHFNRGTIHHGILAPVTKGTTTSCKNLTIQVNISPLCVTSKSSSRSQLKCLHLHPGKSTHKNTKSLNYETLMCQRV